MIRTSMAAVAALALLAGCGHDFEDLPAQARVSGATVTGDGTQVAFSIGLCARPLLEFTVEETPDEVRVEAVTEPGPDPDDCALQEQVTLEEPLGERAVIDVGTGEPITQIYDGTDAAAAEPVPATGLPTVEMSVDEDGPPDVAGAWDASDFVVLATVAGVTDGARFYGGDEPEDPGESLWTEDVELQLEVIDYLKGPERERLDIRWPMYKTREASSATRTRVLEIAGVRRELDREGRYVFFLTDYGEPFGLTSVSLDASLIEIGADLTIQGQVSTVFEEHRGEPLADVLPEGTQLDAG